MHITEASKHSISYTAVPVSELIRQLAYIYK